MIVLLLTAWALNHLNSSVQWVDVMDLLNVSARGRERYTQVAVLCLSLIGVTLVVRILRSK